MNSRVGRYALVKKIGRGGMADVWIGRVQGAGGFEKLVAIKLLAPDQVDREEYQKALTDEARIQAHLKHPNIVDIYDLNYEAETPYLVMEYVEGIELRELLRALRKKGERLPLGAAGFIALEIASALDFAHNRTNRETGEPLHIVHRDVSPSNALLSLQGDIKLSDFGIAKSALQTSMTQVGQIKGKFRYMSPEQAEGIALDRRSDIFSLGLVFFEMLFGIPAYEDASDVKILQQARTGDVALPEGLPASLLNIFKKLLARPPEDRYASLEEFRTDLSSFLRIEREDFNRNQFRKYLESLDLPQFAEAANLRQEAAAWQPKQETQIIDQTGKIVTLAETVAFSTRKPRRQFLYGGLGLFAVIASFFSYQQFHRAAGNASAPQPSTPVTASAMTQERSSQPLQPSPSKPPEAKPEVKKARVSFGAEPYAEVSIPGQFSNLETPTTRMLPPGTYTVSFSHAASGRRINASLSATSGGSYSCFANMALTDPGANPAASCRAR